ncbi:hypothetical protein VCSRO111_0630 [Vibrio cholerae]|uniref:hypothetical protein n=1 Tax=Vibrio cholerae TaxID=666 RepID=UPI0011D6C646|nr:hypothetical protein [Vibrio cholerae]TXY57659.1 hypothetical protein FXE91_10905 [Vibrio cholerae]GHX89615.1 hypothetical protein VCSRO111_0630 [Vibrio cholerae]
MTQDQTPLSDMRGCKSLHAYAVILEKQNKVLTRALLEIESSPFDVAGFPSAKEVAGWMNGRATQAIADAMEIESAANDPD